MVFMADEELDNLPPEERIRKLKELEEKKRKEIEEARKKLKESEKELVDREEWERKVPIPQVATEETSGMSAAEKEIVKAHKGISEKGKTSEGDEETEDSIGVASKSPVLASEESLEEIAAREKAELSAGLKGSEYTLKLSQEPMGDLYREMKDIYRATEEKGYVSPEEGRKIEYLSAATERKLEDIEAGKYSLSEELEEAAVLAKQMGGTLMDMYKHSGEKGQKGMYQR